MFLWVFFSSHLVLIDWKGFMLQQYPERIYNRIQIRTSYYKCINSYIRLFKPNCNAVYVATSCGTNIQVKLFAAPTCMAPQLVWPLSVAISGQACILLETTNAGGMLAVELGWAPPLGVYKLMLLTSPWPSSCVHTITSTYFWCICVHACAYN